MKEGGSGGDLVTNSCAACVPIPAVGAVWAARWWLKRQVQVLLAQRWSAGAGSLDCDPCHAREPSAACLFPIHQLR